jgi:Subtilisin inhibitor-like
MRGAVALAFAAAALCACAAGSAGTSATGTALTVTFWEDGAKTADRMQWTLRCNPPRGTLPRAPTACRKLAAGGAKLFAPVPDDAACTQIYGGPQVAKVVGTVKGVRVWARVNRTNGCQIERWERLSPWLLPAGSVR